MKTYTSCNCAYCRHSPSNVKKEHKRKAHRKLRRLTRIAIEKDDFDAFPFVVSTGYKY